MNLESEARLLVEDVAADDPVLGTALGEVVDALLGRIHELEEWLTTQEVRAAA